jgi:putative ABC transport system substrate-binding protein
LRLTSDLQRLAAILPVCLVAVCSLLVAPCPPAHAEQQRKIHRIGYLSVRNPAVESSRAAAIRSALRDFGYIEGQNIALEYRYAEGRRERFPDIAAELVRLNVDVIVVAGGDAMVRAAMNATKTIPIVMSGGGADPVASRAIQSLSRPGGNVTGLTNITGELSGKRLELLKEVVSKLTRVAILYEPTNPQSVTEVKETLPVAARALGLTLLPWEIRQLAEFERVFVAVGRNRPDGFYASPGALMNTHRKRIVGFASKSNLPAVYARQEYVDDGGLMCYGADTLDQYRRIAWYVDKILKGTKAGDLPVEQPTKFELVVNLQAAKQIGLMIPPNVLARADRVIK